MSTLPPGNIVENRPSLWLNEGWRLARTAPGACASPAELGAVDAQWHEAEVPGTVAASIHADLAERGDYDADDWWYRLALKLPSTPAQAGAQSVTARRYRLRFEGLATLADVWVNGTLVLQACNMFRTYRVDVTTLLREDNDIVIRFASLERALAVRRPRPKWKTQLVARQELRWIRTTLMGRIPGWTPPVAPVGPWAPIALEIVDGIDIESLSVRARAAGGDGHLTVDLRAAMPEGERIAEARVQVGERTFPLTVERAGAHQIVHGETAIPSIALWWPHTHGTPARHRCRIELRVGSRWESVDCGVVGFRSIEVRGCDPLVADGPVEFLVNGERVFCRGACWMPLDILRLRSDAAALRAALEQARDAGANMIRVSGTTVYESEDFYRLCDELGLLVWQDFMFANMDYPFGDAAFRAEALTEARDQLARLARHACIAAYCGGSEVAQQAAMLGLARPHWLHPFYAEDLPRLCAERDPGIPYFPATPWGGALPFHTAAGLTHYYGVGAYRRPLADAAAARVKFTPECLGFSNVPDDATVALVAPGAAPAPHDPRWKARVPRDSGAGYDFEDVRDHYFREFFRADPVAARMRDAAGYLRASRVVSAEAMRRVFAQWRAVASGCGGALVWFLRDLWPGAGWGVVDSTGRAKAAYWALKRAWQPRSLHLVDEGLDGYAIHVVNEPAAALDAEVEVRLLHAGRAAAPPVKTRVQVPARGAARLQLDALLGYFSDANDAYRFGAAKFDAVAARLAIDGIAVSQDVCFPTGLALPPAAAGGVRARVVEAGGETEILISSDVFLQFVAIDAGDCVPDDNYFHVLPGEEKRVLLSPSPLGRGGGHAISVSALNLAAPIEVSR